MSSSLMSNWKRPWAIWFSISTRPTSILSKSALEMMPFSHSMRACAREPLMSCEYIDLSTCNDAPNAWVNDPTLFSNLPPHKAPME